MGKRNALGRGLEALIPKKTSDENTGGIVTIGIDEIFPGKFQPRKVFGEEGINELAQSIKEKGVIQPLVVRRTDSGYELIAGERRWRASRKAGIKDVPAIVVNVNDRESLELALVENLQREDLNALEEAQAYKKLLDEFNYSQEEVAHRVGKNRTTVNNALRLLKLPKEIREELSKGTISAGHARALLALEMPAAQRETCRKIIKYGMSVRAAERTVKNFNKRDREKKKVLKPASIRSLEDELKRVLGTKVEIKSKGKGGKIEIEFYSLEDIDRILDVLRS